MRGPKSLNTSGFTAVEIVLACAIFPIIVIGLANAFVSLQKQYQLSRQFNEMYAVLSACPEIDRALEFTVLANNTNCSPNNTFQAEGGLSVINTYSPNLTVKDTSSLGNTDSLKNIPDSKVVDVTVSVPNRNTPPFELRMLVTRNGIGQL